MYANNIMICIENLFVCNGLVFVGYLTYILLCLCS